MERAVIVEYNQSVQTQLLSQLTIPIVTRVPWRSEQLACSLYILDVVIPGGYWSQKDKAFKYPGGTWSGQKAGQSHPPAYHP